MMIIANFIGILLFLFIIWKSLKDDYHIEKIFNLGFLLVIVFIVGSFILKFFLGEYWFWVYFVILVTTSVIASKQQKMKFFETLEALVISTLSCLSLFYIIDAVTKSSLGSFVVFWVTLICIFLYFFSLANYRRFTWYKSGRVGFSGIVAAILFFIFRTISSIFYPNIISYVKNLEIIFSGSATLLLLILLYNLSTTKE